MLDRIDDVSAPAAGRAAPRISFVSLGCPKALVDSERIITRLRAEGYEITRIDMAPDRLEALRGDAEELAIVCEFASETAPARWTLWPLSRTLGWLQKIEGRLGADDFALVAEDD